MLLLTAIYMCIVITAHLFFLFFLALHLLHCSQSPNVYNSLEFTCFWCNHFYSIKKHPAMALSLSLNETGHSFYNGRNTRNPLMESYHHSRPLSRFLTNANHSARTTTSIYQGIRFPSRNKTISSTFHIHIPQNAIKIQTNLSYLIWWYFRWMKYS